MEIVLVGSGHVAHHLGHAFYKQGHQIVQVYNRTLYRADELAKTVESIAINEIKKLYLDADLYVIAVSDDALPVVIHLLPTTIQGTVVHTSGATDMSILSKFGKHGVVYPLQSLSKEVDTEIAKIPFGIEANHQSTRDILMVLLHQISPLSFPCTSAQRLSLHLAAVFVNNFSNALFQIAYALLEKENLPFDLIRPIILETAKKVQNHLPEEVQTGPASRNDQITIEKHLDYLKQHPDWQKIYQLISTFIRKK